MAATPAPSRIVNDVASTETLFKEAKDSFLRGLSDEEKAKFRSCGSAEELLQSTMDLSRGQDDSLLKKMLKCVSSLHMYIKPYFSVLGLFVQSNPEWAAIAWGSLRLVLQLASNYSSFFERLGGLLDELNANLPRFKDLLEILIKAREHCVSKRLQFSIQSFYLDLFHLFQAVSAVFTKKSKWFGKSDAIRTARVCWLPFDVKFGSIISRLKGHRDVVKEEIQIINTALQVTSCESQLKSLKIAEQNEKTASKIAANQTKLQRDINGGLEKLRIAKEQEEEMLREFMARQLADVQAMRQLLAEREFESVRDRIRAFLRVPEFEDDLERAQAERKEGTGIWLFDHPSLIKWATDCTGGIFWVNGNPGSGKTVLAGAAVSELPARMSSSSDVISAFYFFKRTDNDSQATKTLKNNAYRAILAQVIAAAWTNETLMNAVTYAMRTSEQGTATPKTLRDLLCIVASCVPHLLIIVDGIDECDDQDEFVKGFTTFFQGSDTKILLFSRPNVEGLRQSIPKDCLITICESFNRTDIHLYCTNRINELVSARLLLRDCPPISEMADCITAGANGMFLWARLLFIYLESRALAPPGKAPLVRLNAIKSLRYPDSLDEMYIRIIGLIWDSESYERQLAREVFRWILCEKSTIPAHQLHCILDFSYGPEDTENAQVVTTLQEGDADADELEFSTFSDLIIMACSGLVELRPAGNVGKHYQFIHLSAAEFVSRRIQNQGLDTQCSREAIKYFSFCKPEVEAGLAVKCLKYLTCKLPGKPLSGNMFQPAQMGLVEQAIPFCDYAGKYWSAHLQSCSTCEHGSYQETARSLLSSISAFLCGKAVLMSWLELIYVFGGPRSICDIADRVMPWIAWAKGRGYRESCWMLDPTPLEDLESFMCDLIKIDDEWGTSLLSAPEQIWQDITAFTRSRFLLQTAATTVEQLHLNELSHSSLSTVCICKISEDSLDGTETAILEIWPSRAFQELWNKASGPLDLNDSNLYDECDGWAARYQIWNIEGETSRVKEDYVIPLDRREVWLQARSFVMGSYVPQEKRSVLEPTFGLHFPTCIQKTNLARFAILRTLYSISREHTPARNPTIPRYRSHVMPLDFSERLKRMWPPLGSDVSSTMKWSSKYTYGVQLSGCGRYALYWDLRESPSTAKRRVRTATTLAAFKMPDLDLSRSNHLPAEFLGCLNGGSPYDSYVEWGFHPTLPVLAVQEYSHFARTPRLQLWNFDCSGHANPVENFEVMGKLAEQINFSDCGTYVITKLIGHACPRIKSVETSKVIESARETAQEIRLEPTAATQAPAAVAIVPRDVASPISHGIKLFQGQDGMQGFQQVALANTGVQGIDLVQCGRGFETRQLILSLPKSIVKDHVKVSVHAPKTQEDKITVLLNRSSRPLYNLSMNDDETKGPMVIRKDQRALGPAQKRKLLFSGEETEDGERHKRRII